MRRKLTTWGYVKTVLALGRIPFAAEVSMWTLFGSLLGARLFSSASLWDLHWSVILQNSLITFATNVSINYGNEYFEWDHDRPEMLEYMRKRDGLSEQKSEGQTNGKEVRPVKNAKMLSSHTLPIHDGTIPPWVCLACVVVWQAAVFVGITYSRSFDPTISPSASALSSFRSPFKGLALQLGIFCVVLSQEYVGPPLRLHYHGWGELISALFLCPFATLFGMVSYFTKITGKPVHLTDLLSPERGVMPLDRVIWMLIAGFYLLEQARILVMHIHDFGADEEGGKRTFVVRIGQSAATKLYLLLNVVAVAILSYVYVSFERDVQTCKQNSRGFVHATRTGLGITLALATGIIAITSQSLFAHLPPSESRRMYSAPLAAMGVLAPMVSLELLLLPIVMTVTLIAYW